MARDLLSKIYSIQFIFTLLLDLVMLAFGIGMFIAFLGYTSLCDVM